MYMDTRGEKIIPERSSAAKDSHRKEVLWQITIPFILGLVVLLALAVGSVFLSNGAVSRWASISLIWLILPNLLFTLIFTIILGAILYGVIKLIGAMPGLFLKLYDILDKVQEKLVQFQNTAAKPIFTVGGWTAAVKALFGKQS
jgi:hypothetical protein